MSGKTAVYPIFKGLQKPLEFMGIRGRFLLIAAGTFGAAFLGYLGTYFLFGQMVGIITLVAMAAGGLVTIYIKQKSGLHNKKKQRGIFIYHTIFRNEIT